MNESYPRLSPGSIEALRAAVEDLDIALAGLMFPWQRVRILSARSRLIAELGACS